MLFNKKTFLLFLTCCTLLKAQQGEYFVTNYLPKNYLAQANNFAIVQNNDGRLLIANKSGLLVFDGLNWITTHTLDETSVMTLYKSSANKTYYSLENDGEFGYIERNKIGKYNFNNLLIKLTANQKPKTIIRQIGEINKTIYFLASDKLIELKDDKLNAISPKNNFNARFNLFGKHLFVTDLNNGIFVLIDGVLKPVNTPEQLKNSKAFFTYKLSATKFAIGYRNEGIYIASYDSVSPQNTSFTKFNAPCDAELIESEINNGTQLNDGTFIFTSNKKGAFIINNKLEIIKRFNDQSGLYENNIKGAYQDYNGNLWLPTYYGVSYVELNSPLLIYNRSNGISGLVQASCYYNNKLYVATDKGLQVFNAAINKFENVLNFNKQVWHLIVANNNLLLATRNGLFTYNGSTITQLSESITNYIYQDKKNNTLIYAATDFGVEAYKALPNKFEIQNTFELNSEVRSITADKYNNVYFSTIDKGIYFINKNKNSTLDSITEKQGLPNLLESFVFNYKNELLVGTDKGMYTIVADKTNNFICKKHPVFYFATKNNEVFRAAELDGDLLCSQNIKLDNYDKYEQKFIYLENHQSKFIINNSGISRLKDVKPNSINYDTTRKVVLISSDEGLFMLSKQTKIENRTYNLFLRSVITKQDTIIENATYTTAFVKPIIVYANNDINFKIGYNCFENPEIIELSYYLEGRDKDYGKYEKKFDINYSNLSEGDYTFHVKAKNEQTKQLLELHYAFTILPPWYRTIWAYIFYVLIALSLVYLIIKLYTKRLQEQNLKLEETVKLRTETIEEQVYLLEHQKKEITDSINYAQRIQQSVLPSLKEITDTYANYFLFFQPKDIVSGDFYWFKKINENEFFIACCDCTGHGVPGAFMSTICSEKLTEACSHTSQPNQVLKLANNSIKAVLKQYEGKNSKSKDGMEVALIKYNTQTKLVTYTGANRPLWVVKNCENLSGITNKELLEIKPNKASIASTTDFNFDYEQHELTLQTNDTIYLTTDGFPDQFGGPEGKKFMSRNMKSFLIEICDLPMSEQQTLVEVKINNWKGALEQIDDLLVIGIKA